MRPLAGRRQSADRGYRIALRGFPRGAGELPGGWWAVRVAWRPNFTLRRPRFALGRDRSPFGRHRTSRRSLRSSGRLP